MNDMDKNQTMFAQEQVVSEPTEIEKIQNRVANFAVRVKPNTAEAISATLQMCLSKGMFGIDDLDAVVTIREEITKGLIEYRSTVENAQKQLDSAVEEQQKVLQAEAEARVEADRQRLIDERLLRKRTEDRVAQMEAALAKAGLHIDLNGDGIVGLQQGQPEDTLTANEQSQVAEMLAQSKEAVHAPVDSSPYKHTMPVPPVAPVEPTKPHQTSNAFKLARMLNPVSEVPEPSESEIMQSELEPIYHPTEHDESDDLEDAKQIEAELDAVLSGERVISEDPEFVERIEKATKSFKDFVPSDVVAGGVDTESFMEEVASVDPDVDPDSDFEDSAEFYNGEEETTKTPIAAGVYVEHTETPDEEPTLDIGYSSSNPMVTAGNAPNITGVEIGENDVVIRSDAIKIMDEIPTPSVQEEDEFEEVVIPNRAELNAMTKKQLSNSAEKLSFTIDKKLTKAKMVDSFEEQSIVLIEELTAGEEFVSATEEDVDGDEDRRDGGYF